MIRYALLCAKDHAFESWFPSADSYDDQRRRKLVSCPVCGTTEVAKQVMAPAIAHKRRSGRNAELEQPSADALPQAAPPGQEPPGQSLAIPAPVPAPVAMVGDHDRRLREMVRELHAHVARHTDDVGRDFAVEARRIHAGTAEARGIRGQATRDEAEDLLADGIGVMALPALPDERN